jgi:hypothetical protein
MAQGTKPSSTFLLSMSVQLAEIKRCDDQRLADDFRLIDVDDVLAWPIISRSKKFYILSFVVCGI